MANALTEAETERQKAAAAAMGRAAAIMARLRGPAGCPWDREQTFDSIKRHTLEEVYEVFDAIERRAWPELRDELGDLFLQVLFYAQMASDAGHFTLEDVAEALSRKLIRRHPHIFADAVAEDTEAVLRNWDEIKREERRTNTPGSEAVSALDNISRTMPAMLEASRIGSRAAKAGFDWTAVEDLLAKVDEERQEIAAELQEGTRDALELEVGDLLFTVVNLARHIGIDPESALRRTNAKFRRRYAAMEAMAGGDEAFKAVLRDEKEVLWRRAKHNDEHRSAKP